MERGRIWRSLAVAGGLILLSAGVSAHSPGEPAEPLCGRLSEHDGLRVLELWGTPEQAAYAHGYLLAEEIIALFDEYMFSEVVVPDARVYEAMLVPGVRRQFSWSEQCEAELKAMGRGMRDRLGSENVRSEKLGRELGVEDLMIGNALADWFGMLCSTVSVWGDRTIDGQTLTARNLDFPSTTSMAAGQIVVVRRGDGVRRSWIGITWPAMIGVYTAINDEGVTMLMHDANGLAPSQANGFTPRALILREALETASAAAFVEDVARVFRSRRVLIGNNIHVSGPLGVGKAPAVVFEYDANERESGVTLRGVENGGSPFENALWCTNHLRARREPVPCRRYEILRGELCQPAAERGRFNASSLLQLVCQARQKTTLHSVCLVPHKQEMHVLIPAIRERVVAFDLRQWLQRPTNVSGRAEEAPSKGG